MISEHAMASIARKSRLPMRHAAFVFCGGALLASATNTTLRHAEVNALRRADRDPSRRTRRRLVVLSVRVGKNGALLNARPCWACMIAMREIGVRKVYFTVDGGMLAIKLHSRQ